MVGRKGRRRGYLVFLGLMLPLSGCAGSLHPLFETEKDLVEPKDFFGVWDAGKWAFRATALDREKKDRLIKIDLLEDPAIGRITPTTPRLPDTAAMLEGGLVKVGDQVFVDITFQPEFLPLHAPDFALSIRMLIVPVHSFLKVDLKEDELTLHRLDLQKLDGLLAKNPKLIAHKKFAADLDYPAWRTNDANESMLNLHGPSLLLTAEPAELRTFLAKHTNAGIWEAHKFRRGDEQEFEKRWQKVWDRLEEARNRRKKDEIPRGRLEMPRPKAPPQLDPR
jgi:hypothetical protein